jgi:2-polyprenyl-6-methoxyphenol hydroxylase-like FAD-dependent oxidoreductase
MCEHGHAVPDVVVIGGGPTGVLLALLLARERIDVTVVEQRTTVSERPRAIGIHPPAARILRGCGVPLEHAVCISSGSARDGDRVLGRIDFAKPVLSLPQREIERELRSLLATEAPGSLTTGITALAVRQVDGGVIVETDGGTVTAHLAVAADGADSGVRARAGIAWRSLPGRADYLMADVADETEFGDEAALWFVAGGVVESFPVPERRRRWVARVPQRSGAEANDLARMIAERTGVIVPQRTGEVSRFTASQHLAARWVQGRIVLLGDAAHEVSPIGGQGMNLGILDVVPLAKAVTAAVASDDTRMLLQWEAARRHSARRAMAQAGFNMAMGIRLPRFVQPVRRGAIRLMTLSPVRSRLADAFTMTDL